MARHPAMHHALAMTALTAGIFAMTFSSNAPTALYQLYQAQWGFPASVLTAVFAVHSLGVLLTLLLAGSLSDGIGRRGVIVGGLLLVALGALLFCLAQSVAWLFAARLLTGAGTGALTGVATAALTELDPRRDPVRAAALATVTFTSGAAVGPAVGAAAIHFDVWPLLLPFVLTIALAGGSALALCLVPWPTSQVFARPGMRLRDWRPQKVVVPRRILPAFSLAVGGVMLAWSVGSLYASLSPTLATELFGLRSPAAAALFAVVFQLIGGIAQFSFRRFRPRLILSIAPGVLSLGLLTSVTAFLLSSPPLFLLGTMAAAMGFGGCFVGAVARVNQVAPVESRGGVLSAFFVVAYLTLALPVLGVGQMADRFGLAVAMGVFCTVVVLLATAVTAGALLSSRE